MNRLSQTFFAACILAFFWAAQASEGERPRQLVLHFFGSQTCLECQEIKKVLLEPLASSYQEKLRIVFHEIEEAEGFGLMDKMEKAYGVPESSPQQLFFPDTFLTGFDDIMEHAHELIEVRLSDPSKWVPKFTAEERAGASTSDILKEKFERFTFLGILAAGLVDGVNPCAIATMIFLVSFLAMKKRSRAEVMVVGLCFTAAVFVTYLMVGLGIFKALTMLDQYRWLAKGIRWTAVLFALTVSFFSFWDAFRFKKTGKAKDVRIQLPNALKLRIHRIISANLSGTRLAFGAIVTGFLVTLLEAVCTGQVYVPTLVLMTQESGLQLKGWLYLLFYNFLFVLPLLLVMGFAAYGLTWNRLSKASQKHLPLLKMLLGTVLLALAVFLYFSI